MTDRELLELAARAAGYTTEHPWNVLRLAQKPPLVSLVIYANGEMVHTAWNPLTDDGDALRLAVRLQIIVSPTDHDCTAWRMGEQGGQVNIIGDPAIVTRRAIVYVAAEIGKAMP